MLTEERHIVKNLLSFYLLNRISPYLVKVIIFQKFLSKENLDTNLKNNNFSDLSDDNKTP